MDGSRESQATVSDSSTTTTTTSTGEFASDSGSYDLKSSEDDETVEESVRLKVDQKDSKIDSDTDETSDTDSDSEEEEEEIPLSERLDAIWR